MRDKGVENESEERRMSVRDGERRMRVRGQGVENESKGWGSGE